MQEFMQAHADALGIKRRYFIFLIMDDYKLDKLPDEMKVPSHGAF